MMLESMVEWVVVYRMLVMTAPTAVTTWANLILNFSSSMVCT